MQRDIYDVAEAMRRNDVQVIIIGIIVTAWHAPSLILSSSLFLLFPSFYPKYIIMFLCAFQQNQFCPTTRNNANLEQ